MPIGIIIHHFSVFSISSVVVVDAICADNVQGVSVCAVDMLKSFQKNVVRQSGQGLLAPQSLSTLPLIFSGLLASVRCNAMHD